MSGTLKVTAYTQASGPIPDGTAGKVLDQITDAVAKAIADEGVTDLRAFPLDKTGRGHGNFRTHLHAYRKDRGAYTILGPMIRGQVWSPWLEGTSQRNSSTGFGGYRLFAKTRLDLNRRAAEIAERVVQEHLPMIGGN